MADYFIKYIPSDDSKLIRKKHPALYLLLSLAIERVRWQEEESLQGLIQGDAILGSYEEAGISRQQYRDAIELGVSMGIWEVVWNPKCKKQQKENHQRNHESNRCKYHKHNDLGL